MVQLEEEKVKDAEDTTRCISCGQTFAQAGFEDLTVQLRFVSVIR